METGHRSPPELVDVARAIANALAHPVVITWRASTTGRIEALGSQVPAELVDATTEVIRSAEGVDGAILDVPFTDPSGSRWHACVRAGDAGQLVAVATSLPVEHAHAEPHPAADAVAAALLAVMNQHRFAFVLDNSADIIAVMRHDGTAEYVTPAVEKVLGWPPERYEGESAFLLLHPADQGGVVASVASAITEPGELYAGRFRARHRDGHWVWLEGRVTIAPGRDDVVLFSARDVSDEVEIQQQIDAEEQRYRALLDGSPQAIAIIQDDTVVYVNRASAALLDIDDPAELTGVNASRLSTTPAEVAAQRLEQTRAGIPSGPFDATVNRPDGTLVELEVTLMPTTWNGRAAVQVLAIDVTERRRVEALLEHTSLHDPLTGLPNRHLVADRLDRCLRRARRSATTAALFFCDLDQFKVINDALGHSIGDQVIVEAAQRLQRAVREADTVARFGGDEFLVLSEDLDSDDTVTVLAERIGSAMREPFVLDGHTMHVSVSTGIVRLTGSESREQVLSDADSAMYAAKKAGRDRWVRFDETMRTRASERLNVESALRSSLESGAGIRVHLQPEVELVSGQVVGFEALVRWDGPDGSPLAPDRFLPIAADAGLMPRLGRIIVHRALGAFAELASHRPDLSWVAVNASVEELEHPEFAHLVGAALDLNGLDGSQLCLEVTEHSIMRDPAGIASTLRPLRERGVGIAIDDFGTGYSSLAYLARLQPEFLKIDRSFTADMLDRPDQRSIVEAVLRLAGSLGITAVAEGVETEAQAELLTKLGCQLAQGWHFGRPAPPDTFFRDR